jgi:hypothetical protein
LVSNLGPQSQRTRISEQFNISAEEMLAAVRQQQPEGVIGKRKTSICEGKLAGSLVKMRIN